MSSSLFTKVALGTIAVSSVQRSNEAAKQTAMQHAMLELEQLRSRAEDTQQYMRDTVFKIRTLLVEQMPKLTNGQALYWSLYMEMRLNLEGINADRFASFGDKENASQLISALTDKINELAANIDDSEAIDALRNACICSFALPRLAQTCNLYKLKNALLTIPAYRMRGWICIGGICIVMGIFWAYFGHAIGSGDIPSNFLGGALLLGALVAKPLKPFVLGFWNLSTNDTARQYADLCGLTIDGHTLQPDINSHIRVMDEFLDSINFPRGKDEASSVEAYQQARKYFDEQNHIYQLEG